MAKNPRERKRWTVMIKVTSVTKGKSHKPTAIASDFVYEVLGSHPGIAVRRAVDLLYEEESLKYLTIRDIVCSVTWGGTYTIREEYEERHGYGTFPA